MKLEKCLPNAGTFGPDILDSNNQRKILSTMNQDSLILDITLCREMIMEQVTLFQRFVLQMD